MKLVRYDGNLLKSILREAFPQIPKEAGIGIPSLIDMAASAFFVGSLDLTTYQVRVLQSAKIDLNKFGEFKLSHEADVDTDKASWGTFEVENDLSFKM